MSMTNPSCPQGYNHDDLVAILGYQIEEFWQWMIGQTVSLCDGREYNHETKEYRATVCAEAPHGLVVYASDLERFLRGMPVID